MKPAEWEFMGFTFNMVPVLESLFKGMEEREFQEGEWAIVSGKTIRLLQREIKGYSRMNFKLKAMLQELQDNKSLDHKGPIKQEKQNGYSSKDTSNKKEDDQKNSDKKGRSESKNKSNACRREERSSQNRNSTTRN